MDELTVKEQALLAEERKQQEKNEETRKALKRLIAVGKLPQARPLTRGERRKMDEAGVNIRKIDYRQKTLDAAIDDMADWILENIYPSFAPEFDALPNNVCTLFAMYVYQLTYEDDLAAKN